jgi:hypothetical protein
MTTRQPRYGKDEYARRGNEIYETRVRPRVEASDRGKIVAIDIESGAYEVADDVLTASNLLLAHHPQAQPWLVRIGYAGVHRLGPRAAWQAR